VNARCAPAILPHHALDQFAEPRVDRRASLLARETTPVTAKRAAMPSDNGDGFDDSQHTPPVRPQITQRSSEEAIDLGQLRPATALHGGRELLSQGEIFEHKSSAGQGQGAQRPEGEPQQEKHSGRMRMTGRDRKLVRDSGSILPEIGSDGVFGETQACRRVPRSEI